MPSSSIYLQRTIRVISFILLLISLAILALTGHATWLLNKYFPSGAWYIWRGLDATTYVEQQTPQQWVTVAYDSTTERLAIMRAVLGVVASVLGILAAWSREVDVKEPKPRTQCSQNLYIPTITFSAIAFISTLVSAIWSLVLQYLLAKKCNVPTTLTEYSTKFQCNREQAVCAILPVIAKGDGGRWRQACVETTTVRWLLVPMLILGFVLMVSYLVQVLVARRHATLDRRVEGKVAALEKDD